MSKASVDSFREHDVEGERGLARAGDAGYHRKAVTRDGDVDVFQVVLAGTVHFNAGMRDGSAPRGGGGAPNLFGDLTPGGAQGGRHRVTIL